MAEITKKFHVYSESDNSTIDGTIYDSLDDIDGEYIKLEVDDKLCYLGLTNDTSDSDASKFRIMKNNVTYAVLKEINTGGGSSIIVYYNDGSSKEYKATEINSDTIENKSNVTGVKNGGNITYIGSNAFYYCSNLSSVGNLSNVSYIGENAFMSCFSLATVSNLSNCSYIGSSTFYNCRSLSSVGNLSNCSYIGYNAFSSCSNLTTVGNLSNCSYIGSNAFIYCSNLTSITISYSSVCTLGNNYAFYSTPIASGTGSIYVPASLVSAYKIATNWSEYKSRIFAIPK